MRIPLEGKKSLQWDGLAIALPQILYAIDALAVNLNTRISVTIFCRADWQIEEVMGEASWVFKKTQNVLKRLALRNVQIGLEWHPHLYEKKNGKWELALNEDAQEKQLLDIYAKLIKAGFDVKCSRIGECFFSSTILKTLNAIGIIFDSTAFSGRDIGHTNWLNASPYPYSPALENFTAHGGSKVFEIPFTMIPIKAPYEKDETLRYFNLIFDTSFISEGIKNHDGPAIVTILHPYEILTLDRKNTHQLFGSFNTIIENIKLIYQLYPIQSILLRDYNDN